MSAGEQIMRAVVCKGLGEVVGTIASGNLGLHRDWSPPVCGARGVRIAIVSAGVNFADVLLVQVCRLHCGSSSVARNEVNQCLVQSDEAHGAAVFAC